jgi:hypothetical protein
MSSFEGGAKCRVVPRPHNVRLEELPSLAVCVNDNAYNRKKRIPW